MVVEQLRRRLYALAFVDEFGPLYALFTLWFNDNDVTTSQISVVFVLWAVIGIVLEIPSGALADRVDRRLLVATAFALRAIGITVWMLSPTFGGLIVGAVLWAVHSAFASGAWEALIHDELTALGQQDRYGNVMARIGQFSNLGVALGALVASPLVDLGVGIEALGWLTIGIHAASIALVVTLPDVRWVTDDASTTHTTWMTTLRAGVRAARRTPQVLELIVIGALVEGLFVVDDYVPLLSRQRGASDALTPLVFLAVWVGLIVGGELAARRSALSGRTLGVLLLGASAAMLVAVLTTPIWTLTLVGVGYASLEAALVLSDARLQERAPAGTRATVTSVRSFNAGIIGAVAFAVVGVMTTDDDPTKGLVVALVALAVTGLLTVAWLPNALSAHTPTSDE